MMSISRSLLSYKTFKLSHTNGASKNVKNWYGPEAKLVSSNLKVDFFSKSSIV